MCVSSPGSVRIPSTLTFSSVNLTDRHETPKSVLTLQNSCEIITSEENLSKQLRWPNGKSVRHWSCRFGFDSQSGQTLILVFTASLLDAQHQKDSVENNSASLLVPLGKALNKITPSRCGRQTASNS